MTWEDIIAEDPLEGEIWDDVDFGAESSNGEGWSSDDEDDELGKSRLWEIEDTRMGKGKKNLKRRRSGEGEGEWRGKVWEGIEKETDEDGLAELKARQYWRRESAEAQKEDAEGVDVSLSAGGCKCTLLSSVMPTDDKSGWCVLDF